MNTRAVLCGLVLGMVFVAIPSTSYAQATSDNASVTPQLNDAKTIVAKIKKDAVQMESATLANHRAKLANALCRA